jgi:hypothetical protein
LIFVVVTALIFDDKKKKEINVVVKKLAWFSQVWHLIWDNNGQHLEPIQTDQWLAVPGRYNQECRML